MAWSQGNIRWTSTFKSLSNTTCRIDIYERGYTGAFVQTVKAADNPFFYEEEEDSDILNTVVRYRTGYIRLIEEFESGSTTSLDSIHPTEAFDRYVEVYYGATLIFNGYIQVQDFSNEKVPVPRVVELPIISPLGLMNQQIFSNIIPPTQKTLGQLLNTALSGHYSYVYLPKNYGYPNPVSLDMTIMSTVVSPWNKDYHYSMNVAPASLIMKGESYAYIIEAICKAFGWVAHDMPGSLVFTAFDHEDIYCYYPIGHIGESGYQQDADIPITAETLEDYYTPADDAPSETTIMPDTGIEVEYEGDSYTKEFDFGHFHIPTQDAIVTMPSYASEPDETNSICNLVRIPSLQDTNVTGTLSFDNNDLVALGRGCCAWNGKVGVMNSISGESSQSGNRELFWLRFYFKKRGGQSYRVTYDMEGRKNGYLLQLAVSGSDVDSFYVRNTVDPTNPEYVDVTFYYRWGGNYPALPSQAIIFITNIRLEVLEDAEPYAEYRYKPTGDSDIIPEVYDPQPAITRSVNMPISLYRNNEHLIGSTVRTTKVTEYPYLFQPRKELTEKFRVVELADFYHAALWSYQNKNWRIIAQRFNPWNDEMTLTMQNCALLDT